MFKNISKGIKKVEENLKANDLIKRAKEKRMRKGKKRIVDYKKSLDGRRGILR